jgi:hypothetical protein
MSLPNWRIAYVFGIPIHVHASWFVVFFFLTWSLATGLLPETLPGLSPPRYWGMGAVAALLLFLSVLLHELGHSYVALRYQADYPVHLRGSGAHGKGTAQSASRVFDRDRRAAREFGSWGRLLRRGYGRGIVVRRTRTTRTHRPW